MHFLAYFLYTALRAINTKSYKIFLSRHCIKFGLGFFEVLRGYRSLSLTWSAAIPLISPAIKH